MSGPINGYMNHAAAPAPPPRGLLIKSTGLLTAVSPLCTWLLWDTLPAAALLAPLFLVSIFAGTARAMKKNIHETFLPVLPAVWLISAAYRMAGAPDHFQYHHQPRFADPAQRWHGSQLPAGLDRDAFFRFANVDPRNHFFKKDLVIPWLKTLLDKSDNKN